MAITCYWSQAEYKPVANSSITVYSCQFGLLLSVKQKRRSASTLWKKLLAIIIQANLDSCPLLPKIFPLEKRRWRSTQLETVELSLERHTGPWNTEEQEDLVKSKVKDGPI